jgi:hypothetical protein
MMPFVNLSAQRNAYRQELEKAEKAVLDSGCYIGGPEVQALERELSAYCGGVQTVTCGSGTQAIEIALMVLGLEPGDQVIVPDFTFIAPAECVKKLGAVPKFADIDPRTLQVDHESVERLVGSKTKGIIAVNLFGQCAPYEKLREIAGGVRVAVLHESPFRITDLTEAVAEELPDARMTVCCDLTKMHEKTIYGRPEDVLRQLKENEKTEKGEYCVVLDLHGVPKPEIRPESPAVSAEAILAELMKQGLSLRDAQEELVRRGERKNTVKQAALQLKRWFGEG